MFDLLYGGDLSEVGNDTLNGYNVQHVRPAGPRRRRWRCAATPRATRSSACGPRPPAPSTRVLAGRRGKTESGDFVQVSRLGNPLVNEVVVPAGRERTRSTPRSPGDAPVPGKVDDPEVPKADRGHLRHPGAGRPSATTWCRSSSPASPDGQPRLAGSTPTSRRRPGRDAAAEHGHRRRARARTGSASSAGDNAGFPNGRRLADDVIDIDLQVLEGELLGSPERPRRRRRRQRPAVRHVFPYVALPHSSAVNQSQFTGVTRLAGRIGTPRRWPSPGTPSTAPARCCSRAGSRATCPMRWPATTWPGTSTLRSCSPRHRPCRR